MPDLLVDGHVCGSGTVCVYVHTSFRCSQHVRCAKIARKSPSGVLISCRHPEGILNPWLQISYEELGHKCFLEKENSYRIYVFLGPQGVRIRGYTVLALSFCGSINSGNCVFGRHYFNNSRHFVLKVSLSCRHSSS